MANAKCKILIVEDNSQIRETLKLALEFDGYEVQAAPDGFNGLACLESSPLPRLILLDMLMPGMNGWEFVEKLKEDPTKPVANIPIIAITATTEKIQRTPGEIQGVIRKPFELDEISEKIRHFCE